MLSRSGSNETSVLKFNQLVQEIAVHSGENDDDHMSRVYTLYDATVGVILLMLLERKCFQSIEESMPAVRAGLSVGEASKLNDIPPIGFALVRPLGSHAIPNAELLMGFCVLIMFFLLCLAMESCSFNDILTVFRTIEQQTFPCSLLNPLAVRLSIYEIKKVRSLVYPDHASSYPSQQPLAAHAPTPAVDYGGRHVYGGNYKQANLERSLVASAVLEALMIDEGYIGLLKLKEDLEIDLSSLGTMNTMFTALLGNMYTLDDSDEIQKSSM
ncbi:hypothetical protein Tco_1404456 [Tanacetum coccineum]